jgi:SlyX protein
MEQRLVDLEVRYTHLEQLVQELNDVVFTQQQTIERLLRQLGELSARVMDSDGSTPGEKPPHY